MDKSRAALLANKRGPKAKSHLMTQITGGLIALGSGSGSSSSSNTSTVPIRDQPVSTTLPNKIAIKRENPASSATSGAGSGSLIPVKKPKSLTGRPYADHWEDHALEVKPQALLNSIIQEDNACNDDKVSGLICGAVKQLRSSGSKPDSVVYLTLMFLVKSRPLIFCSDLVVEAFCSLLRRDSTGSKMKPNQLMAVLATNVMSAAYADESSWPNVFVKVFIEDSLGERIWVDNEGCKGFVDNLLTAFNTKQPPKHLMQEGSLTPTNQPLGIVAAKSSSNLEPSSSPPSVTKEVESIDETSSSSVTSITSGTDTKQEQVSEEVLVKPRYVFSADFISEYVSELINDQLNRRQVPSEISRHLLKLLISTIGLQRVRLLVCSRLEIWLQNPKLSRPAQDLLLMLCLNCTEHDVEIISSLVKMRLKTKPLIMHFLACIKELISQSDECLALVLRAAVSSELSSTRGLNNLQLISVIFQSFPLKATRTLAAIFHESLLREDCLRLIRALLREIVRTLRHDSIDLYQFLSHFSQCITSKWPDADISDYQIIRDRMLTSTADLFTMCMFLSVSPAVKESLNKTEKKATLRTFQNSISDIQCLLIKWLQGLNIRQYKVERSEFTRCLNKGLFVETQDQYASKDNWPPEADRNLMFRLCTEVSTSEETLLRLLNMGLSKEHPLNPQEAIELSDVLIKRGASLYDSDLGSYGLQIKNVDVFKLLLKSTSYRIPENISLPFGYQPPTMAISDWYWKVWTQLLIITAHNPSEFGSLAWSTYPILALLIEMSITNHFEFPPPSRGSEEEAEMKARELQQSMIEKQQILQFESHLAAASTKMQINESNSLLLTKLITFDPSGPPRKPPSGLLEQLKQLNTGLRLGHLLCQSRQPDFLLEIIQRQQKQSLTNSSSIATAGSTASPSMPWLNELVENNSDNYSILPVQCLCEFVLGGIGDECNQQNTFTVVELKHAEKVKRKERRKKLVRIASYLQNILSKNTSKNAKDIIEYFMKRLTFQQLAFRLLSSKALSLILSANAPTEVDFCNIDLRSVSVDEWLHENLPNLPHFGAVKLIVCRSLKSALLVETNPASVCSYVKFLAKFAVNTSEENSDDDQLLKDVSLSLSHLMIDRLIIFRYLLQTPKMRQTFISCSIQIFEAYLSLMQRETVALRGKESVINQDHILIEWESKESIVLNILIVHAMIILLTYEYPADEDEAPENLIAYKRMLDTWFGDPLPKAFLVDTGEEALLIPDWLKLKLMRSTTSPRLIDCALKDIETSQLLLFIQSFGIPVSSMEKLLAQLDICSQLDPEAVRSQISDEKYMRQLVEVQFLRGVRSGHVFAEVLGVQPNGSVSECQENATVY